MKAEEIKLLRMSLGLTQKAFAELVEVDTITVSRWENGKCSPLRPYVKAMEQLATKPPLAPPKAASEAVKIKRAKSTSQSGQPTPRPFTSFSKSQQVGK